MINIFFVPGMFGSTLEYMLRNYTQNFENVKGHITADGSLHSIIKEWHPRKLNHLKKYREKIKISTPTFPWSDAKLKTILSSWPARLDQSKNICIRAKTVEDAELNLLFQFYKTVKGVVNNKFAIFGKDSSTHFSKWNQNYVHWLDMEKWELREWFSINYHEWVTEWINVENDLKDYKNFLVLNNTDIIKDLNLEFTKIVSHCDLTEDKSEEYYEFISNWTTAQQYILEEFALIDKIVKSTSKNLYFDWSDSRLCIISECIIQKRLRDNGFEIKCYDLNDFPTNSEQLYNLLEKIGENNGSKMA